LRVAESVGKEVGFGVERRKLGLKHRKKVWGKLLSGTVGKLYCWRRRWVGMGEAVNVGSGVEVGVGAIGTLGSGRPKWKVIDIAAT
jgi:hypothetical protein